MNSDIDFGNAWPECLGSFDEESCRWFLHEVGSRTVPNYPFSFGMEEVYSLVLDEYGLSGTADVLSILQELLEDDGNAAGNGDDGDVWRSWRHGWRHRNDDALNPFIAHVGSTVLPPPTHLHIRRLKNENFLLSRARTTCSIRSSTEQNEHSLPKSSNSTLTPRISSTSALWERANTEARHLDDGSEPDESNAPRDRYSVCTVRFDPTLVAVCETNEPLNTSSSSSRIGQEDNLNDLESISQGEAGKVWEERRDIEVEAAAVPPSSEVLEPHTLRASASNVAVASSVLQTPSAAQIKGKKSTGILLRPKSLLRAKRCTPRSGALEAIAGATDTSQAQHASCPPNRDSIKRTQNREARLIDGTIFVAQARRSKTVKHQRQSDATLASEKSSRRSSVRLSWSPKGQRDSLRNKWTHELRHLFYRNKETGIVSDNTKHQSVPVPSQRCPPPSSTNMSAGYSKPTTLQKRPDSTKQPEFGCDGTSEPQGHLSTALLDLNKPLPLNPEEVVRSMSSRAQTLTSNHSDTTSIPPSTPSTASSISKCSSRKDFRGTTRDLLHQAMPLQHELPPISEVSTQQKCTGEPQKSPRVALSHVSYSSVAQANPFIDDEYSAAFHKLPPLPATMSRSTQKMPGEYNTVRLEETRNTKSSELVRSATAVETAPPEEGTPQSPRPKSRRGRRFKTSSPATPDQKENIPPASPTKRSRSPIKKILSMVKSGSANKLEETEMPPVTPGSGSYNRSLKKWGDRIRYGFLTPDQEQLRQEELLEQHQNESALSTPEKVTFPISLDPPLQAKVQSEIELILSVTANRYLLHEAAAGRLSAESIANTKEQWEKLNRPQVIEFLYDSTTQHSLIMANLDRVKLHGDAANDAIAINSTMRGWKTLAREISVRTFCSPDSVIRKHLHDAHRVLELLGAPLVTFLAYEDMQLKTLSTISHRQKERMDRRRTGSLSQPQTRNPSTSSQGTQTHRRNFSEGSHQHDYADYPVTSLQMDKISLSPTPTPYSQPRPRKATGAAGAVMSLPTNFERSRDRYKHVHAAGSIPALPKGGRIVNGVKEI